MKGIPERHRIRGKHLSWVLLRDTSHLVFFESALQVISDGLPTLIGNVHRADKHSYVAEFSLLIKIDMIKQTIFFKAYPVTIPVAVDLLVKPQLSDIVQIRRHGLQSLGRELFLPDPECLCRN